MRRYLTSSTRGAYRCLAPATAVAICLATLGCGSGQLPVALVKGKVTYKGKPLEFGSILFQPQMGQTATGQIKSDGTFVLSTYATGDGAIIGKHKVAIACNETQKPGYQVPKGQEAPVGKSLIPDKYRLPDTSGQTAEVTKGGPNEFTFNLTD
jgi:hypothetical protein